MLDYNLISKRALGIITLKEETETATRLIILNSFKPDTQKKVNIKFTDNKNAKTTKEIIEQFMNVKLQLEEEYKEYADTFDFIEPTLNHLLEEISKNPKDKKLIDILEETIRPYKKHMTKMISYAKKQNTEEDTNDGTRFDPTA